MTSRKYCVWDKQEWAKSNEGKEINSTAFANDDPKAIDYDKHGTVYHTNGQEKPQDLNWTREKILEAKKRKPKHLFRKKHSHE